MADWKQIDLFLDCQASPDLIDYACHLLFESGALGSQVQYAPGYLENHPNLFGELPAAKPQKEFTNQTQVSAFFDKKVNLTELESHLHSQGLTDFQIACQDLEIENWQSNWMKYYHVQEISRFIKIVPIWESYQQKFIDEKVIYLDPGVAFGTGDHPTTQLGAQALELVLRGGETVLDVGTGSGILSFIAYALGAKRVYGYDLDPQAVDAALSNLDHQQLEGINEGVTFQVNDLLKGVDQSAQVIVANILPHILIHLFEDAYKLLTSKGYLILGGILNEKAQEVLAVLDETKWEIIQKNHYQGWTGLIVQKKD